MGALNVLRKGLARSLFLALVVLLFTGNVFATAAETEDMDVIIRWVNGKAVSENGTYLTDTWAVDGTGVDPKEYVLIGQDSTEVMRVANYPDDIKGGDTSPCELSSLRLSLSLPEGVVGDVLVLIENESAQYMLTFAEAKGYVLEREVYPGVYAIADIEVMSDVQGSYSASDVTEIDATGVGNTVALTIVEGDSVAGESTEETDAGTPEGEEPEESQGGWWTSEDEDNDLWEDTVKLVVSVVILLVVYAYIKFKRAKAEERKQ